MKQSGEWKDGRIDGRASKWCTRGKIGPPESNYQTTSAPDKLAGERGAEEQPVVVVVLLSPCSLPPLISGIVATDGRSQ